MIIVGYQGIGKSTVTKMTKGVLDLESSNTKVNGVRNDDWYIVYSQFAEDLSRQFDKNFKLELYDIEEDEDTILLT